MNVLITGTSSGIGAGLASFYLKNNAKVFGVSRKANKDLEHENFHFLSLDLSDFMVVQEKLPLLLKQVKTLDLVVLNAGIMNDVKDMSDTTLDEINRTMNINVWANKVLIDILFTTVSEIKQVVAVSSGASVSGSRGWNAYALSKATLNMLMQLYAKEHGQTHFCALAPGLIDTNMQEYVSNLPDSDKFPIVRVLKDARGTSIMPQPDEAAAMLSEAFEKVKSLESGSYADVRKL